LNRKATFAVLTSAALVCAAVILFVLYQIDTVRDRVYTMRPGAFNYLMQADHNIDSLAAALTDYKHQHERDDNLELARDEYLRRFDVLWSFLQVFEVSFQQDTSYDKLVDQFVIETTNYLTAAEPLMTNDNLLTRVEAEQQIETVVALGEDIRHIGQEYFFQSAKQRDRWSEQLDTLYRVATVFAVLLMVFIGLLVAYLYRTKRRALVLVEESRDWSTSYVVAG